MKITKEWLKEHGWEVNYYDIPNLKLFHYANKMFGKNMVELNDKGQMKVFRGYDDGDVYSDCLIDNVDSVEKLTEALILCGVVVKDSLTTTRESLLNEFLDKACRWLVEHTHDAATLGNITCTSVMTEGTLIEDFRKAMETLKEPLNTTE